MAIYVDGNNIALEVKGFETTTGPISSGSAHTLPVGFAYLLGSGKNLDVFFNGQLLMEGASNDYVEDTPLTIKFNFTVPTGANLIYIAHYRDNVF